MSLFRSIFTEQSLSKVAVICDGGQLTYEQLRDQTIGMARVLQLLGVTNGDRVALLLNDSPEFITSFVATCSSGAIAVPINMALRFEEQVSILEDCAASVVLGEANFCQHLLANIKRLSHLRDIVVVRNATQEWADSTQIKIHLLEELIKRAEGHHSVPPYTDADKSQPAFILYTSGSTGEPKGAVHRQSDISYTNATFCHQVLRLRDGDRLFSSSRLPFAYGLGNSLTFPLLNGHPTILCREKPTPEIIARVLDEYRPTIFFAVPVVYNLLLDQHRRHTLNCSSLRLCISAGEALPAHLGKEWERTFGVPVLDGIGSTEMLHMWMSNREGEVRYGSSGKLLQGYEAKLLDGDGDETPSGEEGNLWVRGASAALGYWGKPDATARTFVDGWVRTGDLYRCDTDKYWYHLGRSDDCFKSSGQWVSPVEVEAALLRHDGVGQAAVVADFDDVGLPCASAFVVCKQVEFDPLEIEAELREFVSDVLPRFKQPRRYLFVEELPYTATGKVQRFKLRERLRGISDE